MSRNFTRILGVGGIVLHAQVPAIFLEHDVLLASRNIQSHATLLDRDPRRQSALQIAPASRSLLLVHREIRTVRLLRLG